MVKEHMFWDQDAAKFIEDRWQGKATARFDQQETRRVLQASLQGCQGTLLEIGCGPGFWLRQLEMYTAFSVRIGIDRSPVMVRLAQEAGVEALVADAHALPFEDNTFDAVLSIHVLEYTDDPSRFLQEARRVLRPGGRCCIITKNPWGLPWRWARSLSERLAPNPLIFHCLSPEQIATHWGSVPFIHTWISARLITNLNDVNDAVHLTCPDWLERSLLWISGLLQPLLRCDPWGKWLAWHVAILLNKEEEARLD